MFSLELRLLGRGSLEARLTALDQEASVLASFLSDAPAELASAVLLLLEGASSARCAWQDEPGEYRWLFEREADLLRLTLRAFPDNYSRQDDRHGVLLFQSEDRLRRFASRLRQELHYFLVTIGADGYERHWGHPFPTREYQRLEHWLSGPPRNAPPGASAK